MSLTIRRAARDEAPRLLELITALAHFEKLVPPDEAAQARLLEHGWGAQPRFEAWLAWLDEQPVGYAIAFETYSTFLAQPTLYLEDLFVLPAHRWKGIGRAFFQTLTADALRRGCGRMEWSCLDWNVNALAFYDKLGAKPLSDWIYHRLTADEMREIARKDADADRS